MTGPQQRVEIHEPDRPAREVVLDGPVDVGRECEGIVLDDPQVSRRHARLAPADGGMVVRDLGSTNGTFVDGQALTGERTVGPGEVVQLGRTTIVVLGGRATVAAPPVDDARLTAVGTAPEPPTVEAPARPAPPAGPSSAAAPSAVAAPPPPAAPPPVRPALAALTARETEAAVIRYRPGSAGEAAAAGMAKALRRARKRLAGLGSEPWGTRPQVCLVDPFPDPSRPGQLVSSGTVVDADQGEIWMVVTAESPPEPPERPLALLFGAALPAGAELAPLLEGFGLHVAEAPDPDPDLRGRPLPPLGQAEGELASAMALSLVRHLAGKHGLDKVRRFLAEARPGRLDAAAEEILGASLGSLEEEWRRQLLTDVEPVRPAQFFRLTTRYLRPHIRREAEMFAYMLLSLAFTVVFPFAFRSLIDEAIPSGRMSEVMEVLGLLGVAFVISMVANLRRSYLSAYVSAAVVQRIRTEMFDKLQQLSLRWFTGRQQGDVISRVVADVSQLEYGLSQTLREGVFQAVSLVVGAVVLYLLEPFLALIVLAGLPLIVVVYRRMSAGFQDRSIVVQEEMGAMVAVSTENFAAQPVVKAFGLEGREHARFSRVTDRLFKNQLRLSLFGGIFTISVTMIITGLKLFVIGLGAWLIFRGRLTIGGLAAFVGTADQVISPVTALTGIGQEVQSASGALVRIQEVTDAQPEIEDAPGARDLPPLSREIRLAGVSFSHSPDRQTLADLDLVIPAGTRTAFVGPTGAGKSSVLQLLMRFQDPDEGGVHFDGRDLRDATLASLRGQLGVVFQDTFLFDGTIRENIALGRPGATDDEIVAAARAAELHEFVASLPRGYDSPVGERGSRLSGGQRQRLAIARALVRDPRVLILDEATSALDPRTERLIADTLEKVAAGRTTVAVTHRLRAVTGYDLIVVLVEGRAVEQGTHEELLAAGGVYAELWAEQTGAAAPSEPPFDAAAALARIPLFAALDPAQLDAVAGRLHTAELAAGGQLASGGGRMVLVRRGRGRVLTPGVGGEMVPVADLGPGDAFGVSAVLGDDTGSVLQASEPLGLLVLDDESLASVAAAYPAVAAVLEGATGPAPTPVGGRRLSRVTGGPAGDRIVPAGPAPSRPSLPLPPPSGAFRASERW